MHAQIQRVIERLLLPMHREDDDPGRKTFAPQFARDFQTGHAREIDIEDRNVRFVLENQFKRRHAVTGFSNKLETRIGFNYLPQPSSEKRMVIYNDYSNPCSHSVKMNNSRVKSEDISTA